MPDVTTLSPDALQYSEINRQSDLARTPIQFAQSLGGGLQAGKAIQDVQDQNAKREQAAQFEQILQAGLPAMKQAWAELGPEGQKKVPDPTLFADSRDAVTSWWGLATEARSRAQVSTAITAGDWGGAAAAAIPLAKDPSGMINEGQKTAAELAKERAKAEEKAKKDSLLGDWMGTQTKKMAKVGFSLDDKFLNEFSSSFPTDLVGFEPAEKWRDNFVKKAAPSPFATPNSMTEDEKNYWADQYAQGKVDPNFLASMFSSRGGNKAQMLAEITRRAQGINPDVSISGDIAGQSSAKDQKNRRTVAAIDNAKSRIDKFTELSNSIDRTQFPTLNKWIQSGKKGSGDVKATLAKLSSVLMSDELTQVFANGQGGSDMQRKMSSELADPNLSPEQFQADMNLLKDFLDTRRSTFTKIMGRYAAPDPNAPAPTKPGAAVKPKSDPLGLF
jgi:hypothetical protein